jgi:hypothetical protein
MPEWLIRITLPSRLAFVLAAECRKTRRTKLAASSGSTASQTTQYLA